jgi:hypothetical protein
MVSAVRLRNRFWLHMKRSFWGSFISHLLAVEFEIAQLPRRQISPLPAVETIGTRAGAWNKTDGSYGSCDNPTSQSEESAHENQEHLPTVRPIDVPVSYQP